MYSYTNTLGDVVKVSEEHVQASLKIYEELKKLSPSGRVNWKNHKRLMEQAGFSDSEVSENYRRLVKQARYRNGSVPTVDEYKNSVISEKLNILKDEIGNLRLEKEDVRQNYLRLNKMVRETTKGLLLIESVKQSIDSFDWSIFRANDYLPVFDSDKPIKKAVVFISDLHYGYNGKNALEEYNTEQSAHILKQYASKVAKLLKSENVEDVFVVNLGDLIEGNLRNQSLFDTQTTLSDQTIEATDLIVEFLMYLSNHFNVCYTGIAGNHDRLTPNIKESIVGDHVMTLSNSIIKRIAEHSKLFTFVDPQDDYFTFIEVDGVNILAVHGDRTSVKSDSALAEQSLLFGIDFDILVGGHFHSHQVREIGCDKYIALFGSLKGSDDFSIKLGKSSSRSQGVILIGEDGFEIRQVKIN
ncbi:TPA: metallophosphoesterase [Streptococcus suis]